MKTQEEINKKLEEMYGADFDCGLDKTGDNHVLKFYLESINDNFLPQIVVNRRSNVFLTWMFAVNVSGNALCGQYSGTLSP